MSACIESSGPAAKTGRGSRLTTPPPVTQTAGVAAPDRRAQLLEIARDLTAAQIGSLATLAERINAGMDPDAAGALCLAECGIAAEPAPAAVDTRWAPLPRLKALDRASRTARSAAEIIRCFGELDALNRRDLTRADWPDEDRDMGRWCDVESRLLRKLAKAPALDADAMAWMIRRVTDDHHLRGGYSHPDNLRRLLLRVRRELRRAGKPAPAAPATDLDRLCADYRRTCTAVNAGEGPGTGTPDDAVWMAYERARDAVCAHVPRTLDECRALARLADWEARGGSEDGQLRDWEHTPASTMAWGVVQALSGQMQADPDCPVAAAVPALIRAHAAVVATDRAAVAAPAGPGQKALSEQARRACQAVQVEEDHVALELRATSARGAMTHLLLAGYAASLLVDCQFSEQRQVEEMGERIVRLMHSAVAVLEGMPGCALPELRKEYLPPRLDPWTKPAPAMGEAA